jgi:hypothetical protein
MSRFFQPREDHRSNELKNGVKDLKINRPRRSEEFRDEGVWVYICTLRTEISLERQVGGPKERRPVAFVYAK